MKYNLILIFILINTSLKSQVPSTPYVVRRPELRFNSMTLSVSNGQIAYDFRIANGGTTQVIECGFIYSYNTIHSISLIPASSLDSKAIANTTSELV